MRKLNVLRILYFLLISLAIGFLWVPEGFFYLRILSGLYIILFLSFLLELAQTKEVNGDVLFNKIVAGQIKQNGNYLRKTAMGLFITSTLIYGAAMAWPNVQKFGLNLMSFAISFCFLGILYFVVNFFSIKELISKIEEFSQNQSASKQA